ncbi:type II restriction endonuclease [Aurantiacibacter sp. MUD11]|uniref:type II restriction endonuclease n=1 Tax=Aurantiacibacter sp. MUD11 TaxID=3003265 RepID=UPI0022AA4FAA|nr:type II restriction endonuclease [Aurantiacibacter sp. MUD11]WAT19257.1 type II restriction endonuclease [Aurantiacibacter sp. MUD11]
MKHLIEELDSEDWHTAASEIQIYLRGKLLGSDGLIKSVRSTLDDERQERTEACKRDFAAKNDLDGLDDRVNEFLSTLKTINDRVQDEIYFDFPVNAQRIKDLLPLEEGLEQIFAHVLEPNELSPVAQFRLNAILCRVLNASLGQSNKSNAGNAGEFMAEAILNAAGLTEGRDYRKQYKSKKGSDTDYVIPAVDDFRDHEVDAFIAVQISTNDRARLASSELKTGAKKYLVTGNGTDAASKALKDIGYQIIADYRENLVLIVCHAAEIEREKARLRSKLRANPRDEETRSRLEYVANLTLSFEAFAKRMRDNFAKP